MNTILKLASLVKTESLESSLLLKSKTTYTKLINFTVTYCIHKATQNKHLFHIFHLDLCFRVMFVMQNAPLFQPLLFISLKKLFLVFIRID